MPPRPGIYEAFLTVYDKAGNQAHRKSRFGWSDAPLIANIQSDPLYISPNGDGVQDQTQISYTAVQALSTQFTVSAVGKTLLGLGGLALSLGGLYWLISNGEQSRRASGSTGQ